MNENMNVAPEVVEDVLRKADDVLEKYDYYERDHLRDFINVSLEAKTDLRSILRNHPNWNEERQYISFSADTERKIDPERMKDFWNYYCGRRKWGRNSREEEQWDLMSQIVRKSTIENEGNQFPDDELVKLVNEFLALFNRGHITKETKISKVINKCAKLLEMDKHTEVRIVRWADESGNIHEKEKDYGWNYQFAQFADGINPIKIKRHTIISINPVDYLTMSIGDSWNSCHSIENADDPGCYSSGTVSYALDNVTIIFYYVDNSYDENEYFSLLPKQKRCAFYLGEDKLIQSRVYPDGRDGGDCGLAEEVRNIMQKVIADCMDIPNLWTLVKGRETARSLIETCGSQYPDYIHYNDVTTSFRLVNGEKNNTKIKVGHTPFCIKCGSYYSIDEHDHIYCEDCRNENNYDYYCSECGEGFNGGEWDAIYIERDDRQFCCSRCAERYGYVWCALDDDWAMEDEAYRDELSGDCFFDDSEMVETYEGYYYYTEERAIDDGCRYCEDIGRYSNDWFEDSYDGLYYYYTDGMVEVDGNKYYNAENARADGYEMYRGQWYSTDEIEEMIKEVA